MLLRFDLSVTQRGFINGLPVPRQIESMATVQASQSQRELLPTQMPEPADNLRIA